MAIAQIKYIPHCSKCGAIIDEKISYKEIQLDNDDAKIYHRYIKYDNKITLVSPQRCTKCGAVFDCIEIAPPKKIIDDNDF